MELDVKDRKILAELEMNARVPWSELAKKVGVSKQVVKYRVERLEKEEFIQGYNAIVDVNKLGQVIYVVYLKLVRMSSSSEFGWMNAIDKDANVLGVGKNAGYWDLTIALRVRNHHEFDEVFKRITSGKQDKIKEKLVTSEIESTYFSTRLVFDSKTKEFATSSNGDVKVDEKDLELLKFLSEDCRISLLNLSEKVRMSPNGVKERIKALENRNVIIGYKTKLNYEQLGYLHFRVFLHLNKFSAEIYNGVRTFLKKKGNVESVSRYVGYADVDFRCYAKTLEEFYSFVSEVKDKFLQNIIEVDSMPIFRWGRIGYFSG